jgi:hypothetical protein
MLIPERLHEKIPDAVALPAGHAFGGEYGA